MRQTFKSSELRGLPEGQLSQRLNDMVQATRQPLNGEIKELNERIARFEHRFGLTSDALRRALAEGSLKETWEICEWLGLASLRDDLAALTSRSS